MGDIVTPYVYSHSTATGDPGHGKVQFNNDTPASSAAIYVSNLGTDNRTLRSALQSWADADGNLSGKLEVTKAADTNQKILFDVTGKLEKGAEFTKLLVQHVDYTGTFTDGDQLAFSFKDGRFPWAILGTVIALAPIFMATVFLSRRRMDVAVLLAACGVLMLVLLAASYRPRVETLPPGAGLLLTRLHLTPNPSAPDQIDAATKAASAELPNPVVLAIKHTVIWCLLLALVLFAAVEAIFQFVWTDAGENPKTLEKWKGFFDGYYVLLSVSIMLLVVRDWVFANTTPAEEPFLDNPLRGLGFIGSRMTAFKVWESLLWKLVWPVRLFVRLFLQPDSAIRMARRDVQREPLLRRCDVPVLRCARAGGLVLVEGAEGDRVFHCLVFHQLPANWEFSLHHRQHHGRAIHVPATDWVRSVYCNWRGSVGAAVGRRAG